MRYALVGCVGLLLTIFVVFAHHSYAQPSDLIFAETGYALREPFLSFWQEGGVAASGYPISPELQELNPDDGQVYTVQYFERVRLEYHPGANALIQVGRLGAQRLHMLVEQERQLFPPAAAMQTIRLLNITEETCLTFATVEHALCGQFAALWQRTGGVARYGYPLTALVVQRMADGRPLVVQYTERARFEFDPVRHEVTLGLLGREVYQPTADVHPPLSSGNAVEAHLLALINQERLVAGLQPLKPALELMTAARQHSQDMADNGIISHVGSDGRTSGQRIQAAGYRYVRHGENIAVSWSTPAEALRFWMGSPPHRANLLDPGMTEVGVGYVQQAGLYHHYWTMKLGQR